ncbi:MOS1T-like protein [Mya arenaria]|uniref:MOS1T-like protein n=1 Tax=Mya arenaria TaxID=6604 RepID=A0ABY7EDL2_MYAAR|nr:MOS1T-like protein [Mya arenaria]
MDELLPINGLGKTVVRRDMVQSLRKKRPGMDEDIENVLLHQDNAPAHRARYTELELVVLGIGRLEHAPNSPDPAPLDFALFPAIKAQLRGIRFDDLESLRRHVQTIMSSFDKMVSNCLHIMGQET